MDLLILIRVATIGVFFLFLFLSISLVIFYLHKKPNLKKFQKASVIAIGFVVSIMIIQICFGLMITIELKMWPPIVKSLYEYGTNQAGMFPGQTVHYSEHHYINYVLNANLKYADSAQINKSFKIRRSEAIRPRDQVKRRILILGGSTTFGEFIPREEDTWVYNLEKIIR